VILKILNYIPSNGIVIWCIGKEAEHSGGSASLRAIGANICFIFGDQKTYSVGMTESEELVIMVYCHRAGWALLI
jgi:hypothetical protein